PIAVRNALRRPARLAMTMALLVVGGALVIAAASVGRGLSLITTKLERARRGDVEIRLHEPMPIERAQALAAVTGVRTVEAWSAHDAALGRPGQAAEIVHTYPDGGHGSFMLVAPPLTGTTLVDYPVREGRWLRPDDTDGVVLGHLAAGRA